MNQSFGRVHVSVAIVCVQESENMNPHYRIENLLHVVANLFAAGTDTTATTLRWGLLLMAKYPKIQGKVCVWVQDTSLVVVAARTWTSLWMQYSWLHLVSTT